MGRNYSLFQSSNSIDGIDSKSDHKQNPTLCEQLEERLFLSGTTYTIDSLNDVVADDGAITLREAIEAANTNEAVFDAPAGSADATDIINFSPSLFTDGENVVPGTITLNGELLYIQDDLTINGPGSEILTIDANNQSGVFSGRSCNLKINGITITGGQTDYVGGGIQFGRGTLTLDRVNISDNSASSGGGINLFGQSQLFISNSIISNNHAISSGGGFYAQDYSNILISNSTISGNSAKRGGGIFTSFIDEIIINNSIISMNHSHEYETNTYDYDYLLYIGDHRYYSYEKSDGNILADFTSKGSLIGIDPGFVRNPNSGEDGIWGTSDDDAGDLHLSPSSIAIDTGINDLAVNRYYQALYADISGQPRIVGQNVDIGAYEYEPDEGEFRESPSTVVTTLDDIIDTTDGLISLREAIIYEETTHSTIRFSPDIAGGTIFLTLGELEIRDSLAIDATNSGPITIDAMHQSRCFNIIGDYLDVSITGLIITNGSAQASDTIQGNYYALGNGGGINSNYNNLTLINTVVCGNTANNMGGGIDSKGKLNLTHVTISGNSASKFGGVHGIFMTENATINNSIIALNHASLRDDIYYPLSHKYNVIGMDPGFVQNPSPGTDGIWGTADDDIGDLHLKDTSICINLANHSYSTGDNGLKLHVDIENNDRLWGGVDIGAYEFQGDVGEAREEPSLIVTTLEDAVNSEDGLISIREAILHSLYTQYQSTISFDSSLAGGTILLSGQGLGIYDSVSIDARDIGGITIDANGQSGVFNICGQYNTSVLLAGLAISGGNSDSDASAISNWAAKTTLIDLTVCNNTGHQTSIQNYSGKMKISNVTISKNYSDYSYSSGLRNNIDGIIEADRLYIIGNNVKNAIINEGRLNLANSVICGHEGSYGCAMFNSGQAILTNVTISGNKSYYGEIITNSSPQTDTATLTLINCIISNNEIKDGGKLISKRSAFDSPIYYYNNIIGQDVSFVRNPDAGADGAWGTDDDDYGDLRLSPDSIAIDAGIGDFDIRSDDIAMATDIDGSERFVGSSVDIGAQEYQDVPADINGDETVNIQDFLLLKNNYGSSANQTKATGDLDGDGDVDIRDFLILKGRINAEASAETAKVTARQQETAAPAETSALKSSSSTAPALEAESMLSWVAPIKLNASLPAAMNIQPAREITW